MLHFVADSRYMYCIANIQLHRDSTVGTYRTKLVRTLRKMTRIIQQQQRNTMFSRLFSYCGLLHARRTPCSEEVESLARYELVWLVEERL